MHKQSNYKHGKPTDINFCEYWHMPMKQCALIFVPADVHKISEGMQVSAAELMYRDRNTRPAQITISTIRMLNMCA